MSIDALIVSRDPEVLSVFRLVMESAGINLDESGAVGESLMRLARRRYDAVVVDCDGVPDGEDVIEALRKGKSNKTSIAFALLGPQSKMTRVKELGATFVLHKPISTETVLRSMKASHGLILRERRRYLRHSVETYAHLQVGKLPEMQVSVTDISEGGAAVVLPVEEKVAGEGVLRLMLPEAKDMLEGKAEVVWNKSGRQAGVRFVQLTGQSQKHLMDWLNVKSDMAGLSRDFKTSKRKTRP